MIFAADFLRPHTNFIRVFLTLDGFDKAKAELMRAAVHVVEIDGATIKTDDALFSVLEKTLRFPYFGHTWDALLDCLRDLDWLPAAGYLLVIHNASDAFRTAPKTTARFIELWGDAAEFWTVQRRPFRLALSM